MRLEIKNKGDIAMKQKDRRAYCSDPQCLFRQTGRYSDGSRPITEGDRVVDIVPFGPNDAAFYGYEFLHRHPCSGIEYHVSNPRNKFY